MARIPGLDDLKAQNRQLTDIATKIDRISAAAGKYTDSLKESAGEVKDLTHALDNQLKSMEAAASSKGGIVSEDDISNAKDLINQLDKISKKTTTLAGGVKKLGEGFDKLGKGLIMMGVSGLTKGVDILIDSIQRVYDLKERWAKVTGEVNKKLGGLSPNMKAFGKDAKYAEGAIRGLGGELGDGTKLFADFVDAFGSMDKKDMKDWSKLGVQIAQGFNLGGEAAGKFSRVLSDIGFDESKKEGSKFMAALTADADTAGVSVNALAKDFSEASNFVAQFGKNGVKALSQSAAHLKRFNISLKDAEKMMSKFDTFDDAAQNVSKLNTVFGTTINSLDMMLEQDPAKRFEKIRQGLLAQGKSYDSLSRSQRQFLEQTTGLDQQQIAAMLSEKNRNKSLADIQKEKDKREKAEANAQKLMQKQLRATATTLHNFGMDMDKITVAIGNAIKPFLVLLGLADKGSNKFGSFDDIMKRITTKVVDFFNALADNKDWSAFMQKAADGVKTAAAFLGDFFSPKNLTKNIETAVDWIKKLWDWSKLLLKVWVGFKALQFFGQAAGAMNNITTMMGAGGAAAGGQSRLSSLLGKSGGGATGAAAGALGSGPSNPMYVTVVGTPSGTSVGNGPGGMEAAAGKKGFFSGKMGTMGMGALTGGLGAAGVAAAGGAGTAGTVGAGLGGAAAGALTSLIPVIGPLLAPIFGQLGGIVGKKAGEWIGEKFDSPETKHLKEATAALAKSQDSLRLAQAGLEIEELKTSQAKELQQRQDNAINDIITKGKKTGIELDSSQRAALVTQISNMTNLGINTDKLKASLGDFGSKNGPLKLTANQISLLKTESAQYLEKVQGLNTASKTFLDNLIDTNKLDAAKREAESQSALVDAQIKQAKVTNEQADAQVSAWDSVKEFVYAIDDATGTSTDAKNQELYDIREKKRARDKSEADVEKLQAKKAILDKKTVDAQIESLKFLTIKNELERLSSDNKFKELQVGRNFDEALKLYSKRYGGVSQGALEFGTKRPGQGQSAQAMPTYALGGYIESNQIAKLHKGEYVLTANQVSALAHGNPRASRLLGSDAGGGGATNFAAGGKKGTTGGDTLKVVAGDVYLDSKLVGRHLIRSVMSDDRG